MGPGRAGRKRRHNAGRCALVGKKRQSDFGANLARAAETQVYGVIAFLPQKGQAKRERVAKVGPCLAWEGG